MSKKSNKTPEQQAPAAVRSSDGFCGVELIRNERARQVMEEGWSPEHDDEHRCRELAKAAVSYVQTHAHPDVWAQNHGELPASTDDWPWAKKWWKPSADPIRNLVKAGALIAAEIDRLKRKAVEDAKCRVCRGTGSIAVVVRGVRSVNPCVTCRATGKRKPQNGRAEAQCPGEKGNNATKPN